MKYIKDANVLDIKPGRKRDDGEEDEEKICAICLCGFEGGGEEC